jgi:hypothetical protein
MYDCLTGFESRGRAKAAPLPSSRAAPSATPLLRSGCCGGRPARLRFPAVRGPLDPLCCLPRQARGTSRLLGCCSTRSGQRQSRRGEHCRLNTGRARRGVCPHGERAFPCTKHTHALIIYMHSMMVYHGENAPGRRAKESCDAAATVARRLQRTQLCSFLAEASCLGIGTLACLGAVSERFRVGYIRCVCVFDVSYRETLVESWNRSRSSALLGRVLHVRTRHPSLRNTHCICIH